MALGGAGTAGDGVRHVHVQQPQHMAPFLQKSVPPPSLGQSDDSVIPISTPETPHGERVGDQAFPLQGVYGPIGSNMPSNPSSQVFSRSIGMSSSLGNSPLSSPQLPHHPRSDIWVYPYGNNGTSSTYTTPTPIGVLPAGYRPPPPPPHPTGVGLNPNPFQRAVGGQVHKSGSGGHHHGNSGNRGLEQRGHSLEEDLLYGNIPVMSSAPYKRWSVPSGMYTPAVGGVHPNSSHSPELPSWGLRGGMAGLGNPVGSIPNVQPMAPPNKKQHVSVGGGGTPISLGDPWPHWISPVPPPQFPPGVSLPHQQKADFSVPPKALSPRLSRSLSVTLEEQWSSSGMQQGAEGRGRGSSGELQQLMRSLDINSEHMQSLKVNLLAVILLYYTHTHICTCCY